MKHLIYIMLLPLLALAACGGKKSSAADSDTQGTAATTVTPSDEATATQGTSDTPRAFSADTAFFYIKAQCDFGPRVPGSEASRACGDFLVETFRRYGATVEEQTAEVVRYDGVRLPARNIIARVNPDASARVLVCAHWDSRPWADHDADASNHHTPLLGANDGASGVGVMLEMCRLMQQESPAIGVDFICFDAEDMGLPEWAEEIDARDETWCLGSRVWAEQAAKSGYQARYGVLLDMVGGYGCTFSREMMSQYFAPWLVQKMWNQAAELGYSSFFPQTDGGYLTDDHINVNTIAGIPCIDVVPYFLSGGSSFGPTWHTMQDTPENIDKNVLNAVGHTLTQMIYNER